MSASSAVGSGWSGTRSWTTVASRTASPGDVGAQRGRARARRIPRREGEVGDLAHHCEPGRQVRRRRHPELGPRQPFARSGEPSGHRRLGHEEQPGQVEGRDADDEPQAQGAGRLRRQ